MTFLWPLAFLSLTLASSARAETKVTELCHIRLEGPEKISFGKTEQQWLCGDPGTPAWKEIPIPQKRLWLKTFLQARGYLRPTITEQNGTVVVEVGRKTLVERFTVEGAPKNWDWSKRRKVKGAPLDPSKLDESTTWAKRALQFRGYPCPKVEASAFLDTNELLLKVTPGPAQTFGPVSSLSSSDMDPRILERFTAFRSEDDFDIRLLELTSDRILREDLYLSTFYDVVCDADQRAHIVRRFVPAAPRLLTFGVGFDTENGPIARARWQRTRLTKKADALEASTLLSFREQQAETTYRYHFPKDPGSSLEFDPKISFDRVNEAQYETITYKVSPALANAFEHQTSQTSARLGPEFRRTLTKRGPGPAQEDSMRLAGDFSFQSHLFEYYSGEPQEGYRVGFNVWGQWEGALAKQTIYQFLLKQEALWNLGHFDPPLFVLGWRGEIGSYFFRSQNPQTDELTVNERYFLGGDDDIRGFGRKKLPGTGFGYLTVLYQGLELRVVDWLPWQVQPFLFFDLAKGGAQAEHLDSPLYYAPGLGVRWSSPVGTLRLSLARGFATELAAGDPDPNLQFFASFGKEF